MYRNWLCFRLCQALKCHVLENSPCSWVIQNNFRKKREASLWNFASHIIEMKKNTETAIPFVYKLSTAYIWNECIRKVDACISQVDNFAFKRNCKNRKRRLVRKNSSTSVIKSVNIVPLSSFALRIHSIYMLSFSGHAH